MDSTAQVIIDMLNEYMSSNHIVVKPYMDRLEILAQPPIAGGEE